MAQATGKVPITPGDDHHAGFNKALTQALHDMDGKFDPGQHTVDVRYQLVVDVNSPGSIGFYQVTVTSS